MADELPRIGAGMSEADRLHERASRLRELSSRDLLFLVDGILAHAVERLMLEGRREIGILARNARMPVVKAIEAEMAERHETLVADFVNRFPDGSMDASTYGDIEDALDRIDAPSVEGHRWLTLPRRIEALGRLHGLPREEG